ncbi:MAG: M1 family metallopeptidase [Thermoplasmata archaeon]|nr:M1 family metallopeptidase [Thermoplasmata archaeon]
MRARDPPQIPEYWLRLEVDFDRGSWTGAVEFPGAPPVGAFDLDSEGLEIRDVRRGSRKLEHSLDPVAGRLSIPVVGEGPDALVVEFAGTLRPKGLLGLYRCRHGEGTVLTTQCEPVGARRIFPCLDRPDRKSRVRLTVRTQPGLEVISNTTASPPRLVGGLSEWSFETTPPMASYLFYLAIGRFDRAEGHSGSVRVRVLAAPGRAADCAYSLDAAIRIVKGCEDYYAVPFPLPKLDLVAVAEHAFGAMENWGAMSFREVRLLIDRGATTLQRRDVFETVAHEIAHQWFGDLVTMSDWDEVWLNESFASFVETRITERLEPTLDARTDAFLRVAGTTAALDADSLPSTHPVRTHLERPEELSQIFDEISYGKGCAVLGMVEAFLGEGRFRAGVTDYLHRFRFGNARTQDLWDALGRASGEAVAGLISPWIDRPGHPVIRLETGTGALTLRQERFSFLGSAAEDPWPIPLRFDIDGESRRMVMNSSEAAIPIPSGATVHLNPGAVGFYRVRYDPTMYERLFAVLPGRPPADRWSVVEDLGAFLLSGDIDWSLYARAVGLLGATTDRLVLESFASTLLWLGLLYPDVGAVQDVVHRFFAQRLAAVGSDAMPGENPTNGVLRERLTVCRVRLDLEYARDLERRFADWDHLDPDLRAGVAVARGRVGGHAGWDELRRALEQSPTEAEWTQLERGLAWAGDADGIVATLHLVESGAIIRSHLGSTLAQVAANPVGRPVLWPWLQQHLPMLEEHFRGSGSLSLLLEAVTPTLGFGRGDELRTYYRNHPFPEGSRGLAKGLYRLEVYERLGARLHRLG